jgi:TonB family protein
MHATDRISWLGLILAALGSLGCQALSRLPTPPLRTPPRADDSYPLDIDKYYPIPSRDLGEEGTCTVNVHVAATGTVSEAKILKSTGFATLDDACVTAMLSARFVAATENAVAIDAWVTIPIAWQIPPITAPTLQRGYVLEVGDDHYPEIARKLHQEGDCIVGVFVTVNGAPQDPYIYQSTGFPALDLACVAAVKKAVFAPGIKQGVPTALPARVSISWRLGKY